MKIDKLTAQAIKTGVASATRVLSSRKKALKLREVALQKRKRALVPQMKAITRLGKVSKAAFESLAADVLVAEGDSWFDYPLHDILKSLDDHYGYDVESVAHAGDAVEQMAYSDGQLDDFTRRIEKIVLGGIVPKAILLSGGGNDVAGPEFGMLLNHIDSPLPGLNEKVVDGVLNERIRLAYVTIISKVTEICRVKAGHEIPILVHGYDYPVPDGRGVLGGAWFLPGPWMEPGFRQKGFKNLQKRIELAGALIDRINEMLEGIASLTSFGHVKYVNLRNSLSTGPNYKNWWANELHPTGKGFNKIADLFAQELDKLP